MATQYILNSIQESKYSGFIEKNMFERVFPQYQLGVFLFLHDKPRQEIFLTELIGRKLRKYHADEDSVCRIETGYVDIACKTGGRYAVFLETYQKTAGERGFPG